MTSATDFLVNIRRIIKLHEHMLKEICQQYQLTQAEGAIISFLNNNPGRDTAADIVELRMLQKGNVSQAVEQLYQKGLLDRRPDGADRRKIHLSLTGEAQPIVAAIQKNWQQFERELFAGVSPEESRVYSRVHQKMQENMRRVTENRAQSRDTKETGKEQRL